MEVAFVVDTTGSMKDDINAVRDSLFDIVDSIASQTEDLTIRFAIVSYRDHPPQDKTYVTRIFDFTEDIKKVHRAISRLDPSKGGDTPEAVADAIHDARVELSWSRDAYKALLLVGDAPPHGRDYNSLGDDYFPNGCPNSFDPKEEMVAFKHSHGETAFVFVCGCNPLVESSFKAIASAVKDGKYYSLSQADELPAAILEILEGVGNLIEIDRRVMAYYQNRDGVFDVGDAAKELDLSLRDLKISISRLMELELIPRWPKGRPLNTDLLGVKVELGEVPDALVAGKGFRYPVEIENPSASTVSIRIVATLVTADGVSEMANERHEISQRSTKEIEVNLVPMVHDGGKASIKVEALYGAQVISSKIYKTRIFEHP
jgi:hypothetical protein